MVKRVTIYDIAEKLGISTATVNRALTDKPKVSVETRKLVLKTAEEMGFKPNTLARSLARRPIQLAVVAFTSFKEFHGPFIQGAKDTYEELRDYNIHLDYFSFEDGNSNSPQGDAFLEKTLLHVADKGYDGLLICAKEIPAFRLLQEKGICVATAVNDITPSLRRFCIRYNGHVAGKIAAELLWRFADRKKRVAIATAGLPGRSIHSEIIEGFMKQTKTMPLDIATIYHHYDNAEAAYYETNRILDENPDLGGIYVNSFNSLGVVQAVKEHGLSGKLCLVTSDIYQDLRTFIQEGTVTASIFQDQYAQGKQGLKYLFQTIADSLEVDDTILIDPQIVLQSNLNLF